MKISFISLFPEMLVGPLGHSILGRAAERGVVEFGFANPRDFTYDRHQKVDDTPFGGEPGMLINAPPVALALESLIRAKTGDPTHCATPSGSVELAGSPGVFDPRLVLCDPSGVGEDDSAGRQEVEDLHAARSLAVILTDPAGVPFTQRSARELSGYEHIVFLCGHYEGFDHRVKTHLATHAFSIGDYVLTNGELPALVMADAIVRLIPGVLGNEGSLEADSHSDGLLSAPNYTRPEEWRGDAVPEVLRSGNHKAIARWRREQALKITKENRPDLLAKAKLEKGDLDMLSS